MILLRGVIALPYSISALFVPTRAESDDIPDELVCFISKELLRDPVWVHGEWHERASAVRMARDGRRTHFGIVMTTNLMIECPEMRDLVRWYRKTHFYSQ